MSIEDADQPQTGLKEKPSLREVATRKIVLTVAFYLVASALVYLLDAVFPGGSCNPGGGMMILLLLPFAVIILGCFHLVKTNHGSKADLVPAIIHAVVLAAYIVIFLILSNR